MSQTPNFKLKKLNRANFYNYEDWNENYDIMDKEMASSDHTHDISQILDLHPATEVSLGLTQYANEEEAIDNNVNNKAMTPETAKTAINHYVVPSSEGTTGIARFATKAEAESGTNSQVAMSPARVHDAIKKIVPDMVKGGVAAGVPHASESVAGIARLASLAEAYAGSSHSATITPYTMNMAVNAKISAAITPATPDEFVTDWYPIPIGAVFPMMNTADITKLNNGKMKFVKLSARDSMNTSFLTDKTPDNSDNMGVNVSTTKATVKNIGSSMDGKDIHMINTDKRYIRASVNAGASYGDAMRPIRGHGGWVAHDTVAGEVPDNYAKKNPFYEEYLGRKEWGSAGGYYNNYLRLDTSRVIPQKTSGVNETVPNTIELSYYMRVK